MPSCTVKALNMQLLGRTLGWLVPHRRRATLSVVLVLLASLLAVMLPVVITRVVIDGIILNEPKLTMPDFGMIALTETGGGVPWRVPVGGRLRCLRCPDGILPRVLSLPPRDLRPRTVLNTLRDLRYDLFKHMEYRPSSFYDKVAIGRVMTRVTNDIQALYELLMGMGMLIGEFVPFFLALALMLAIDVRLTGYLLLAIPVFVVITYFFRQATRRVYRLIRNTVSQLNQNLQENLSGMQVVQLNNREAHNLSVYRDVNSENRQHEMRAINLETSYGAFMDNMVNMALAVILWVGGGSVIQESVSLGSVILFTQFV